ncbi:MAG TPA: ABC transporter ATP-binding protein [Bacillota bacterium]|nr:ABC transporter ATP-binding protein [Bacillota bacterium]
MVLERHPAQTGDADLPENVLLRLQNLSMRFGGLLAVDNLSFDVKQGEIFGLIGPNGAGKTTIFNCITRFYRPTSGEMFYRRNAVEVIRLNDFPVHQIIRQGIVRTFQNVELVWELSVLDNLLVAAHTVYRSGFFAQLLHTPGLRREENVLKAKALGVLQTLGLSAYAYAFPYGLPYGILKKIELARTLMANPRLIILDEPAAGLNDKETEELAVLIRKIRDDYKCTIFLVEHDMGLVMDICDTVCAISFGRMLAIGTPAAIQADPLVRAAYLGEAS